jgi:hypothetical protein
MSILKLKGNDSGTGNVTLEAPNTNTDQTIAIPDGAGSFVTANASGDVDVNGTITSDGLSVDAGTNKIVLGNNFATTGNTDSPKLSFYSFSDISTYPVTGPSIQKINTSSYGAGRLAFFQHGPYDYTTEFEAMSLTSDGNFLVGTSSVISGGVDGANICVNPINEGSIRVSRNSSSNSNQITFWNTNGKVGSITTVSTSTAYNTSSDYRLKENVTDLTGASDRINQIPVHRFNFIADPDRTVDGFLAHEVADIVPEAISGEKDAMRDEEYEVTPAVYEDVIIPAVLDDEGNEIEPERTEQRLVTEAVMGTRQVPDYQGIDQSKLVPLITAALQEALAKIETLETEMTSVKARLDALEAV